MDFNSAEITVMLQDIPWQRIAVYLVLSTLVLGNISTLLRKKFELKDGYSRKINHVGIMLITLPTLAFLPDTQLIPAVFIGSIMLIVIYGMSAMSTSRWTFGIVSGSLRERDAPRARFFFFFPLITFNLTLVVLAFLFPLDVVRIAFFTVAIADGFAEPMGLRFGKNNTYQIRDRIWNTLNTKSIAGSSTVMLLASLTFLIFAALWTPLSLTLITVSLAYGQLVSVVEAFSPRGMDNMLILIIATPLAMQLLSLLNITVA